MEKELDGEGRFLTSKNYDKEKLKPIIKKVVSVLTEFFLETRLFQLSVPNVQPSNVYNRDQVPMALADAYSKTIDEKNKAVI